MFKLLWSPNGRIGRWTYAGGLLLNVVLMLFALAVWQVGTENWTSPELRNGSLLALIPFAVLFCWALLALAAKRLHDQRLVQPSDDRARLRCHRLVQPSDDRAWR